MGIVNAGQLAIYDDLDPELRNVIEDAVLNRVPDSTDRLLEISQKNTKNVIAGEADNGVAEWRTWFREERLKHALVKALANPYYRRHRRSASTIPNTGLEVDRGTVNGRYGRGGGFVW